MAPDSQSQLAGRRRFPALNFGHPAPVLDFWKRLVRGALARSTPTPFYLFSALPVADRILELEQALTGAGFRAPDAQDSSKMVCRHWLSCKTQPVAPLLRWWRRQGRPIEVVSEFELRAALAEGFDPANILVNGPAKHHWLRRLWESPAGASTGLKPGSRPARLASGAPGLRGLSVNFDSPAELAALLPWAGTLDWRCGVRLNSREEFDPEHPEHPTQFGFDPPAAVAALKKLLRAGIRLETVSFHLRTNVATAQIYQRAIAEAAEICRAARFRPKFLDIGGGLPVRHVLTRGGKVFDGAFSLRALAVMLRQAVGAFPGLGEIWLENGRFVSAGGGALVVKILDVKERRGLRQLLCDGGRTLNALTSLWEQHRILALPARAGALVPTAVHGPTCMAFDQLARIPLPCSLRPGDHLVWLDAGAYHLAWETRFSHGHAAVLWHDESGLRVARERQAFEDYWGQWTA